MPATQQERTKKYLKNFKDKRLRIDNNYYEQYEAMIKSKGYTSMNDYVNAVLQLDYNNIIRIPDKKEIKKLKEIQQE